MGKLRTMLSIEGSYYVVVLSFIIGGAVIRQINLLMFVAGIMIGPLLLSWRLSRKSLQRLEVKRSMPRGVGAGELLVAELTIQNQRRRMPSYGLILEDSLRLEGITADQARQFKVPLFLPRLSAGESVQLTYQGRLSQRGRYRAGPIQVTTRFPLGLIRRKLVIDAQTSVFVYPRLGRLTTNWQQLIRPGRVGAQSTQHRRGFVEGEFHGLRDWQNSDSQRWIHWRTTAKRNSLTVKQFERQRNQDLALLVSLQYSDSATPNGDVEAVVRFAATVVAHYCRRGSSRITLGLPGEKPELVGGVSSAGLLQSAMEKLAVVQGTARDQLPQLVHHTLREIPRDTRIVIVSTKPTDLYDTERFHDIWDDPKLRSTLSRIVCLSAGSPEFVSCFEETQLEDARGA